MEKKIVTIILLVFWGIFLNAQKLTFVESNQDTYEKYLRQDWKGLIKAGKRAKKDGLDYYYLNVRMGVAYFKKKQYLNAIPYFEKALKENPKDAFVLDYLYYAYLYTNDELRSEYILNRLPQENKKNKIVTNRKLKDVTVISNYQINQDYDYLSNYNYLEPGLLSVQVNIDKSMYNLDWGLNYQLSPKISAYQLFGFRKINFFYIEQNANDLRFNLSLNEFRYYGKFDFILNSVLKASFNYNVMLGNSQDVVYQSGFGRMSSGYYAVPILWANIAAGGSITAKWRRFELSPHVNALIYNGLNPYLGVDFTFYPFANNDLFLRSDLNFNPKNHENPMVIKAQGGFRLWKFYFVGTYYYGVIDKFIEDNGFYVYNFNYKILSQYAITADFMAKNKTFFVTVVPAVYQMEYTDENNSLSPIYFQNFDNLLFEFGISWKVINNKK